MATSTAAGRSGRSPDVSTVTGSGVPSARRDKIVACSRSAPSNRARPRPPAGRDRRPAVGYRRSRRWSGRAADQQRGGSGRIVRQQAQGRLGVQRHPGQHRTQPVVQVPAQPPPLLLPAGDDPLPRPGDLLGQPAARTATPIGAASSASTRSSAAASRDSPVRSPTTSSPTTSPPEESVRRAGPAAGPVRRQLDPLDHDRRPGQSQYLAERLEHPGQAVPRGAATSVSRSPTAARPGPGHGAPRRTPDPAAAGAGPAAG